MKNENNFDGYRLYNLGNPVDSTDATNKQFVEAGLKGIEDHKMTWEVKKISNVGNPAQPTYGVNKRFVDVVIGIT